MDHDLDVVAMRFGDDRLIHRGREFLYLPAAVVDPGLEHLDVVRLELLHGAADVVFGPDQDRRMAHVVRADLVLRRETAARGQEPRRGRIDALGRLVAQLIGQLAEIGAVGHARDDAVIGEAVHVIEDVLARVVLRPAGEIAHVADMRMRIDQAGDDGLAGEIDSRSTLRHADLAAAADGGDAVAFDDEGRVLDRCGTVAGDEARAFEHGLRACRRCCDPGEADEGNQLANHESLLPALRGVQRNAARAGGKAQDAMILSPPQP